MVIGKESTLRGQVLARGITVKKGGVVSREESLTFTSRLEDIIVDPAGGVYPISELLVTLRDDATPVDAEQIAASVNGRIVGTIASTNLYQIVIPATAIAQIEAALTQLQHSGNPLIEGVSRNFVISVD